MEEGEPNRTVKNESLRRPPRISAWLQIQWIRLLQGRSYIRSCDILWKIEKKSKPIIAAVKNPNMIQIRAQRTLVIMRISFAYSMLISSSKTSTTSTSTTTTTTIVTRIYQHLESQNPFLDKTEFGFWHLTSSGFCIYFFSSKTIKSVSYLGWVRWVSYDYVPKPNPLYFRAAKKCLFFRVFCQQSFSTPSHLQITWAVLYIVDKIHSHTPVITRIFVKKIRYLLHTGNSPSLAWRKKSHFLNLNLIARLKVLEEITNLLHLPGFLYFHPSYEPRCPKPYITYFSMSPWQKTLGFMRMLNFVSRRTLNRYNPIHPISFCFLRRRKLHKTWDLIDGFSKKRFTKAI